MSDAQSFQRVVELFEAARAKDRPERDAFLLDACVFYRRDNWRVNLHLKNLTDEKYEMRGFGSDSVIPASPFAAYAQLGGNLLDVDWSLRCGVV